MARTSARQHTPMPHGRFNVEISHHSPRECKIFEHGGQFRKHLAVGRQSQIRSCFQVDATSIHFPICTLQQIGIEAMPLVIEGVEVIGRFTILETERLSTGSAPSTSFLFSLSLFLLCPFPSLSSMSSFSSLSSVSSFSALSSLSSVSSFSSLSSVSSFSSLSSVSSVSSLSSLSSLCLSLSLLSSLFSLPLLSLSLSLPPPLYLSISLSMVLCFLKS